MSSNTPEPGLDTTRTLLTVELIPETAWGQNLRAVVSKRDWDVLRRWCYRRAGYRCECCGGVGPAHPVDCHEIWDWDEGNGIQWLAGLIALCPTCHSVKHIGRTLAVSANPKQTAEQLRKHIARTNNWDAGKVHEHFDSAQMLWEYRSQFFWTLDVALWLTESIHQGEFELHDFKPAFEKGEL